MRKEEGGRSEKEGGRTEIEGGRKEREEERSERGRKSKMWMRGATGAEGGCG